MGVDTKRHISDEHCSCFGLNRLAAMNSCHAARHRSRFFCCFYANCTNIHVVFMIYVRGFYLMPCWTEIDYQFGEGQG